MRDGFGCVDRCSLCSKTESTEVDCPDQEVVVPVTPQCSVSVLLLCPHAESNVCNVVQSSISFFYVQGIEVECFLKCKHHVLCTGSCKRGQWSAAICMDQ